MTKSEIIVNRKRAQQLLAFDGLEFGRNRNLRPTDIDLSIDWQGRSFVFVELKGPRMPLTTGQKIHLQSLVKAIRAGGKAAVAILAHHDTPDPDHDVMVADSAVALYYDGEGDRWKAPKEPITLKLFMNQLHLKHTKGEL